jgi:hypothetical protein
MVEVLTWVREERRFWNGGSEQAILLDAHPPPSPPPRKFVVFLVPTSRVVLFLVHRAECNGVTIVLGLFVSVLIFLI